MAIDQIPSGLLKDLAIATGKVADDAITGAKIENNPTIAGNLTVAGTSTLSSTLAVTGNATVGGNLTVTGNWTVDGTTTTLNTQTVEVEDNILQLNTTQATPDTATAATSGISVYRGNGVTQASLIFDDADDTWDLTNNIVVAGNIETSTTGKLKSKGEAIMHSLHRSWVMGG